TLAASRLWANSEIRVEKGETVRILFLTGGVNLAAHRLFEAASFDYFPPVGWTYYDNASLPRVESPSLPRPYERRAKYRLHPKAAPGALLMYVVEDGKAPPNPAVRESLRPKVKDLVVWDQIDHWVSDKSGTLYFAVNDIVVDSPEAFIKDIE